MKKILCVELLSSRTMKKQIWLLWSWCFEKTTSMWGPKLKQDAMIQRWWRENGSEQAASPRRLHPAFLIPWPWLWAHPLRRLVLGAPARSQPHLQACNEDIPDLQCCVRIENAVKAQNAVVRESLRGTVVEQCCHSSTLYRITARQKIFQDAPHCAITICVYLQ